MAIKRVLSSSIDFDHPQLGMLYGFRKLFGAEVSEFDYLQLEREKHSRPEINRMFVEAAVALQPDWIWLQLQDTNVLTAETIQEVRGRLPRCVVTHWTGDCRRNVSAYLSSICQATHLTFLSSVGQIPMFREAGAREAIYCQIGLDVQEDIEGMTPWRPSFGVPDVVFCGGYYGDAFPGTVDRADAVRALFNSGIQVGVVGGGWPAGFPVIGQCGVKDQYHVWTRAKVCLNVNHFNDIERYYSDRQLIAMASGTPLVCRYVPGLEKEFRNGHHLFWYKTREELIENVRTLLKNPVAAKSMGAIGRAEVIAHHTWEARFREILPHVERVAKSLGAK